MIVDVSRDSVEGLLESFLAGTQGVALEARVRDLAGLPVWCRAHVKSADKLGRPWVACSTDHGWMTACGDYDKQQSKRVGAHVLFVEWCLPCGEQHAGWYHCYANRPREWICGRGLD